MIFLAPILLPTIGALWLFVICSAMFGVSVLCAYLMPPIADDDDAPDRSWPTWDEFRSAAGDYLGTLRTIGKDHVSSLALIHYATGSSLVLLFAVLVPRYMQAVLEISPDKAVTIFAPVGVGAILGLRALPYVANRLGKNRSVIAGLVGLSLSVIALALIEPFAEWLETTQRLNPFDEGGRAGGLSILMLLTMAFAGPLGFAYAMVNAPAQTTLHERAPADMRGRVFASQVVLANAVGILPLIVAGSVADILGVTLVLFMIAIALAAVAGISIYLEAKWSTGERPAPPLAGVG
jgi:hypothetical protein